MTTNKSFCLNMHRRMLLYYRTTKIATVIDRFYFQIQHVCVHSNNPNIYSKTSQQTFSYDIFGIYNFEGDDWKIGVFLKTPACLLNYVLNFSRLYNCIDHAFNLRFESKQSGSNFWEDVKHENTLISNRNCYCIFRAPYTFECVYLFK